jgi:hypothetical protein
LSWRLLAPDGREVQLVLEPEEWLVRVEKDRAGYRSRDLRAAMSEALGYDERDVWLLATSDQVLAAVGEFSR